MWSLISLIQICRTYSTPRFSFCDISLASGVLLSGIKSLRFNKRNHLLLSGRGNTCIAPYVWRGFDKLTINLLSFNLASKACTPQNAIICYYAEEIISVYRHKSGVWRPFVWHLASFCLASKAYASINVIICYSRDEI